MSGDKWKNRLDKTNVTRSVNARGGGIEIEIGTLSGRVPNKDTWRRTRGEFMRGIWAKPWVTETAKTAKFGVVRRGVKEFEVR